MNPGVINFGRAAFPFLLTLALWRISCTWWNPAGMLCLVPVFYCTFVRPVPWFAPYAFVMCILLDYNFAVPYVWTILWCMTYAANGFQTRIDITRMDLQGFPAFAAFLGIGLIILLILNFEWIALLGAIWSFVWTAALYVPTTALIKRIGDD